MSNFSKALSFTLGAEGGYGNDPLDSGGPTNHGVTQGLFNTYNVRKQRAPKDVKLITKEEVEDVYFSLFWQPNHGDEIPVKIAVALFDWDVNSGESIAAKGLQRQIPGCIPDGVIGFKTVALINAANEEDLLLMYLNARRKFYNNFPEGPLKHQDLHGWLNRVDRLQKYLTDLT